MLPDCSVFSPGLATMCVLHKCLCSAQDLHSSPVSPVKRPAGETQCRAPSSTPEPQQLVSGITAKTPKHSHDHNNVQRPLSGVCAHKSVSRLFVVSSDSPGPNRLTDESPPSWEWSFDYVILKTWLPEVSGLLSASGHLNWWRHNPTHENPACHFYSLFILRLNKLHVL